MSDTSSQKGARIIMPKIGSNEGINTQNSCSPENIKQTVYKYEEVGLIDFTKIMFRELKAIGDRVEKAQNNIVQMQSSIDLLEIC